MLHDDLDFGCTSLGLKSYPITPTVTHGVTNHVYSNL